MLGGDSEGTLGADRQLLAMCLGRLRKQEVNSDLIPTFAGLLARVESAVSFLLLLHTLRSVLEVASEAGTEPVCRAAASTPRCGDGSRPTRCRQSRTCCRSWFGILLSAQVESTSGRP